MSARPISLAELERLAKAASDGSIEKWPGASGVAGGFWHDCFDDLDRSFITAISPDVVLRLVALIRKLAAEVDSANEIAARSPLGMIGPLASQFYARHGITDEERP